MKIDHLSLTTTPIELYNDDKLITQGTGFYIARIEDKNATLFLVTNYHVITDSLPTENKSPAGNRIVFQFHEDKNDPSKVKTVSFSLFTNAGKPIWLINKNFPEADIAVIPIPITLYLNCVVNSITENFAKTKLNIGPSSNVSLIGYPYGIYDKKNSLPIWKKGSIATEPAFNFNGKPLFLVDVSSFPGMSGAPVFSIGHGTFKSEDGKIGTKSIRKFLGIYSSFNHMEFGHVWKADLIIEIINSIDIEEYKNEINSYTELN